MGCVQGKVTVCWSRPRHLKRFLWILWCFLNENANHVKVVAYQMQNHANKPRNHTQTRNSEHTQYCLNETTHANNSHSVDACVPHTHTPNVAVLNLLRSSSSLRSSQCVFVCLQLQSYCVYNVLLTLYTNYQYKVDFIKYNSRCGHDSYWKRPITAPHTTLY